MRTVYDAEDDILTLRISDKPIARETAPDWTTCISYAADGSVVELVILDASTHGVAPLLPLAGHERPPALAAHA